MRANGSLSARLEEEFLKNAERYDEQDESYASLSPKAKTQIAAMSGPPMILETSEENFFKHSTPVHHVHSFMRE